MKVEISDGMESSRKDGDSKVRQSQPIVELKGIDRV